MQRIFNLALTLGCLLFVSSNTTAQQEFPPSPELKQDLQRIATTANELNDSLPSFTCDEMVTSQAIRDNKVRRSVDLSGTVRTLRSATGTITETNVYKRGHILFILPKIAPIYVSGGFAMALSYFLPSAQACYHYSLSQDRIDFESRTDPITVHACKEQGLKGFALLNADGNISHIERTVPPEVAKPLKLATFAAVDLAPVELNGHTYQLSQHLVAEMPLAEATGRFEANYTHCRLFSTTVTLGLSTEIPPDSPSPPQ